MDLNNPICQFNIQWLRGNGDTLISFDSDKIVLTNRNGYLYIFSISQNKMLETEEINKIEDVDTIGLRRNGNLVCYRDKNYSIIDLDEMKVIETIEYENDSLPQTHYENNEFYNLNSFQHTIPDIQTDYFHEGKLESISSSLFQAINGFQGALVGDSLDGSAKCFLYEDDTVRIFSYIDGNFIRTYNIKHKDSYNRAFISPDGKKLIMATHMDEFYVYEV